MLFPRDDADHPLARSFRHFLQDPEFPCVGAKSALSRNQMKIVVARDITSGWDDLRIYPALLAFVSWVQARARPVPELCRYLRDAHNPVRGGLRAPPLGAGAIVLRQGGMAGIAV
jgi:YqcI/YcgG family